MRSWCIKLDHIFISGKKVSLSFPLSLPPLSIHLSLSFSFSLSLSLSVLHTHRRWEVMGLYDWLSLFGGGRRVNALLTSLLSFTTKQSKLFAVYSVWNILLSWLVFNGGREVISNRPGNKNYTGRGTVTEGKLEDYIVQVHGVKRYIYRERENNYFFFCLFLFQCSLTVFYGTGWRQDSQLFWVAEL